MLGIGVLLQGAGARGAVSSLPLEGYYRPGRYMPVRVEGDGPGVEVGGRGVVPTVVHGGAGPVVVPVLMVGHFISSLERRPLHRLRSDQRLIGTVLGDASSHPAWFEDQDRIVLPIEAGMLLGSSAVAWGTLDGLILDRATYERLGDQRIGLLLGAGTALAVRSARRPDSHWPWQADAAGYWQLQSVAGSLPSGQINEAAYRPTFNWAGDWPGDFLWQVGILAAGWAVLVLLTGLAPGRRRLVIIGTAAFLAMAGIRTWRRTAPYLQLNGMIVREDGPLSIQDHWFYQTTPQARSAAFAFQDLTWPVFASMDQMNSCHIRLLCDATGHPVGFVYHLPAKARLAFVGRRIESTTPRNLAEPSTATPLEAMARRLYTGQGVQVVGQISGAKTTTWPTVVLRRFAKTTQDDAQTQHPE